MLQTYVCVWALVSSGTGEGDEFMAPFVDHKTAHCGEKEERDVSLTVSHTPDLRAGLIGRNITAENVCLNNWRKCNQQSSSACLHAYTHENVAKRSRVFGPLMSVASIAWPSPTGHAHRCHSTPTRSADMRICGLAVKKSFFDSGELFSPDVLPVPFICSFIREKKKKSKRFYSHTICLPCSLSGRLFASCALLCSSPPYLGGFFCSLALPASSHLPDNLTTID